MLQLALLNGAEVYTTATNASTENILKKTGAAVFQEPSHLIKKDEQFDIILDTTGNSDLSLAISVLKPYGRIATLFSALTSTRIELHDLFAKNAKLYLENTTTALLHNINRKQHCEILDKTAKLIEQKKIRLNINNRSYKFSEANQAHKDFEKGDYQGKIVLING